MASIDYPDDFPARLSLALQASNLSRAQLSSLLGVHKSMVSRWLSGEMKPTGYNLARLSAALAKAKPGFNMTLWAAPRAEFEAALGLSPVRAAPAAGLEADASLSGRAAEAKQRGASVSPARPLFGAHSVYIAAGAAILVIVILAIGAWLWRSAPLPATHVATAASPESVAVMPFVNMSGDPAKEYLGDGMAEEILNDLANTSNLRVAARTSSFAFKGKHTDIRDIAKALNVRAVLEGSVRQEGDRVRIVAQLIDATNGFHLWSARYDRKLDDILAVQDKIAGAIVGALSQKLVRTRTMPRVAPDAYQNYLQAQYFFRQRTVNGSSRADELLKKVISHQPDFAAAYALRGHLLMLMSAGEDHALLAEAQNMTAKALQLDPGNQDALDTKLEIALRTWDWPAVYRAGRQLLAQPRSANSYNGIGFFYQYMGFPKLALEARGQAVQLDPLSFSYRNNLGAAQWHLGRREEAIATLGRAFELQPNHLAILRELCEFNATFGRMTEARRYRQLIAALHSTRFPWVGATCDIEIALRDRMTAQARILLDQTDWKGFDVAELGLLYARVGDLNRAMKLFSEAYDSRQSWLIWVRYDTATPKAVLADPRWQALWRRPALVSWQHYHDRIASDLAARHLR